MIYLRYIFLTVLIISYVSLSVEIIFLVIGYIST